MENGWNENRQKSAMVDAKRVGRPDQSREHRPHKASGFEGFKSPPDGDLL